MKRKSSLLSYFVLRRILESLNSENLFYKPFQEQMIRKFKNGEAQSLIFMTGETVNYT